MIARPANVGVTIGPRDGAKDPAVENTRKVLHGEKTTAPSVGSKARPQHLSLPVVLTLMAIVIGGSLLLSVRRLRRMDVP